MSNISKNKIIWTNGCFDILHTGHIELLKFAKSKGDFLFVGIDSDNRVKNLKGEKRPINSQWDRKKMLEYLGLKYEPIRDAINNVNAIPYFAYYDVFKNFYANKQEEYFILSLR